MTEFILNNQIIKTDVSEGTTLLDFIRDYKSLKGTKIGCREGDCGACTVLIGTLEKDLVSYRSITSCISPLGNVAGKHIVSIEGVNLEKRLNVVQQEMTNSNGTQCGFCTPGFVVSMTGFALNREDKQLGSLNDAISGNICRCTGYKSIEKAGCEIQDKLSDKNGDHITWLIEKDFIPDYFRSIPDRLKKLNPDVLKTSGRIVANGTDLYVHNADQLVDEEIQLVANIDSLNGITQEGDRTHTGANATVTDIVQSEYFQSQIKDLSSFMKIVSSEPIRNMGTLGGNFVNASPIGDMTIFFLALNSNLIILNNDGVEREIPFSKFHQDYKKYDLQVGELVKSISFPNLQENDHFNFEKVCKRTHLDIASVNCAVRISMKDNIIQSAHISIGGVAAIPKFLQKTSDFLSGKELLPATIVGANEVLQTEISPISDVRGTADYKRLLARQLFFAHFIKLFPQSINLSQLVQTS